MPPGFKGLSDTAELWVPFAMYAPPRAMMPSAARADSPRCARLKPGVTLRGGAERPRRDLPAARTGVSEHQREARRSRVSPLDVELFGDAASARC